MNYPTGNKREIAGVANESPINQTINIHFYTSTLHTNKGEKITKKEGGIHI